MRPRSPCVRGDIFSHYFANLPLVLKKVGKIVAQVLTPFPSPAKRERGASLRARRGEATSVGTLETGTRVFTYSVETRSTGPSFAAPGLPKKNHWQHSAPLPYRSFMLCRRKQHKQGSQILHERHAIFLPSCDPFRSEAFFEDGCSSA